MLSWAIPNATTDRETIHDLGPTEICRGTADLTACGVPVGQVITPAAGLGSFQTEGSRLLHGRASFSARKRLSFGIHLLRCTGLES